MSKTTSQHRNELEYINCVLCGNRRHEEVVWKDYKDSAVVSCKGCGFVYRNPRYCQFQQERIFAEEWTEKRGNFCLTNYRVSSLEYIANYIIKHKKTKGHLLDVGCSCGSFLQFFSDSWELTGIEPSVSASKVASKRIRQALIVNDTIENVSLPNSQYDVITLIDTFFYFREPLEVLTKCHNLLKKDG